jgi:hypothetical protein
MAYNYKQAITTLCAYLEIEEDKISAVEGTNRRGIIYDLNGEKCVIFIYPISCKKNNAQNFLILVIAE